MRHWAATALRAICFLLGPLAVTGAAAARQDVSFPTQDGGRIYAYLYGNDARAVVPAHGGRFTKESREEQAKALVAAGFRVLSINFRGEGKSRGGIEERSIDKRRPLDILAAIHYLRETSAKRVSVVGASMGGDYAAEAAQMEPAEIDRLAPLASGAYTPRTAMKGRKLFLAARDDANDEGPRLPKIRAQYDTAIGPKESMVLDCFAHAQFLFQTDQGARVLREILQFFSAP